jgi:GNAT superfamily N-acetyltransferase
LATDGSDPELEIRALRTDEVEQYRALRLRALEGAPDAFGTLHADALAQSHEEWAGFVRRVADGTWGDLLVAASDLRFHGIAMVYIDEHDGSTAGLGHMWVDEDRRGSGLAAGLLASAEAWALDRAASKMRLWVTEGNARARRAYERAGFAPTGVRQPLREGSALEILEMRKTIHP